MFFDPTAYLIEISMEFENRYPGIKLSVPYLSKFFKDREISHKEAGALISG